MAIEIIDIGNVPNDPNADVLRVGGQKINNNFQRVNDNIDLKKAFRVQPNFTIFDVVAKINALPTFDITEKQSYWFIAVRPIPTADPTAISNVSYKYKLLNKGFGTYGQGGQIQVQYLDLELLGKIDTTASDIQADPSTTVITYTLPEGVDATAQSVSDWLNTQNPPIIIKPQDEGYTLFMSDGNPTYLFIGQSGTYGQGSSQSEASSFQQFADTQPEPEQPVQLQTLNYEFTTDDAGDKIQNDLFIGKKILVIFKNNYSMQSNSFNFDSETGLISGYPYDADELILILYRQL